MPLATIVIAQPNPAIAPGLANELRAHVARVAVTDRTTDLHTILRRREAQVAVLDLETVNLEEICRLASSLDDLTVVCTHRSPDEQMWMAALRAGAVEFRHPQDARSTLRVLRTASKPQTAIDSHPPVTNADHEAGLRMTPTPRVPLMATVKGASTRRWRTEPNCSRAG